VLPVSDAIDRILNACPTLSSTSVPIEHSIGRVLREEIAAPNDFPPFPRVMMDGYAVRTDDLTATNILPLRGEAAAGGVAQPLQSGTCVQVMTGARLPQGADAVVMVEETERVGDGVRFRGAVLKNQHFAPQGEEARRGDVVVPLGTIITPVTVATLAHAGRTQVQVARQPKLAIVSTGDELVPVDQEPLHNQIRDSNSWSLTAQALADGLTEVRRLYAPDDHGKLRATLADALVDDIVVISGGVSAGKYDLVPKILEELEVEEIFHKVFSKPGKPVWFGRRNDTLVFGAPGNPLATVVTFHVYVRAAIARMTGKDPRQPRLVGVLNEDVTYESARDLFAFVCADWDGSTIRVTPLLGKGSADVFAPARANALLRLAAGKHKLSRGDQLEIEILGTAALF